MLTVTRVARVLACLVVVTALPAAAVQNSDLHNNHVSIVWPKGGVETAFPCPGLQGSVGISTPPIYGSVPAS
jgi:hypothetical protein